MYDGYPCLLECLLHHGAGVNARAYDGTTALMVAAEWGRPILVRILLRRGANVNARDNEGYTALAIAQATDSPPWPDHEAEYREIVRLLKRFGGRE
jgi:ankyrin repeat protein